MTLHSMTRPTTSAIDFCACLSALFQDYQNNYYAFDEFVAPFSQVLTLLTAVRQQWMTTRIRAQTSVVLRVMILAEINTLRQRFANVDVGYDGRCRRSVSSAAGWAGDPTRTSGEASRLLPGYVWLDYVCSHGQADELVCQASAGKRWQT